MASPSSCSARWRQACARWCDSRSAMASKLKPALQKLPPEFRQIHNYRLELGDESLIQKVGRCAVGISLAGRAHYRGVAKARECFLVRIADLVHHCLVASNRGR